MKLKTLLKTIPDDVWVFIKDQDRTVYGSSIYRHHTQKINYLFNKKILKVEPRYDTNRNIEGVLYITGVFLYIEIEE